jgi:hypothetical protein
VRAAERHTGTARPTGILPARAAEGLAETLATLKKLVTISP